MRLITFLLASSLWAMPAFAKITKMSPTPKAAQIKGNTERKAEQKTVTAVSVGEGNTATNTAGAIRAGSKIQGNTNINASQNGGTAGSSGTNNIAANEAGVIGGR